MNDEVEAVLKTLPRKIKVGAYDWRIIISKEVCDDFGQADFETATITVWQATHPSPERIVGTVLHELLHVIYGNDVNEDEEESIVTGFETGLIGLFRDNPKLLTWIKRGLKTRGESN